MMTRSRAIVLRTIKHSDTSVIVETYTATEGRTGFLVRIPKTRRATVKNVIFTPLALLELEWNMRPAVNLQRVRNAKPYVVFSSIPFEPKKTCISLFLAEFLCYALRESAPDKDMFDFIETSVRWLDATADNCANFHIAFLLHLSQYLGFYPNLEGYAPHSYFDLTNGRFCTVRPAHTHIIEPSEAGLLPTLMRMKYATAPRFTFTQIQRRRLLNALDEYYRLHLPAFPELKSLEVLRQVFD